MEIIEEKIQLIAKEIAESNASQWTITKIVKALSEINTNSEKKLREKTLEMLKELDPIAAATYERFNKMQVYSSEEKLLPFNRGHIITSLLRETKLSRTAAEKITSEVENQIKDAKINFLNTSLIREMVNAKLISYGFEEIRHNYARLGEPAYDVKEKLQEKPYSGETVREYNLSLVLPKKARELHFSSTIYIEDTEGFSHRPYAYTFISEKKETLHKTISANLKTLIKNRDNFFLPPNIFGLTYACSNFVKNENQSKKIAEQIINYFSICEENYNTSIELFTPQAIEKIDGSRILAAQIGDHLIGRIPCVVGIDSKYSLKLINTTKKTFTILNNSDSEYYPLNGNLFSDTKGILLFTNINLEKIAQDSDPDLFFERLREIGEEIKLIENQKMKLVSEKKYLNDIPKEELKCGIGLTNLLKVGENFEGIKTVEFANKIYKELAKTFDEELLFGCTQTAAEKFSTESGKEIISQEMLGFEECLSSKKTCFTGKAINLKQLEELIENKVKQIEYFG